MNYTLPIGITKLQLTHHNSSTKTKRKALLVGLMSRFWF